MCSRLTLGELRSKKGGSEKGFALFKNIGFARGQPGWFTTDLVSSENRFSILHSGDYLDDSG